MLYLLPSWRELLLDTPSLLIPLWQVLLFIVLISIASVFERYRLVLILAYTFAFYWVFVENLKSLCVNKVSIFAVVVFLLFGVVGLGLAVYHMATSKY